MKLNVKWTLGSLGMALVIGGSAVLAAPRVAYLPPSAQVQQALAFDPFNVKVPAVAVAAAAVVSSAVTVTPATRVPYTPPPRSPFLPDPVGPLLP